MEGLLPGTGTGTRSQQAPPYVCVCTAVCIGTCTVCITVGACHETACACAAGRQAVVKGGGAGSGGTHRLSWKLEPARARVVQGSRLRRPFAAQVQCRLLGGVCVLELLLPTAAAPRNAQSVSVHHHVPCTVLLSFARFGPLLAVAQCQHRQQPVFLCCVPSLVRFACMRSGGKC